MNRGVIIVLAIGLALAAGVMYATGSDGQSPCAQSKSCPLSAATEAKCPVKAAAAAAPEAAACCPHKDGAEKLSVAGATTRPASEAKAANSCEAKAKVACDAKAVTACEAKTVSACEAKTSSACEAKAVTAIGECVEKKCPLSGVKASVPPSAAALAASTTQPDRN